MTYKYEICWTFIAFVFSTIRPVQKSPLLRVKENSVISVLGQFCGLAPDRSPPPEPRTLSSWKQRGHSQRLFIGATLMCGLTADISNIKLWATSELCREPPVSCLVIPHLMLMEMLRGSLYCGWKQARTELSVYMFIKQFRAIWCLYCHACCYTVGYDYLCHYLPTGTDKPITAGDGWMRGFTLL